VSRVVLEAVTPAALEVAFEVFDELRRRKAEVDRLRRAQVQRAREDAELAQRQFMLVRPEHRLVADTLEQQWNEKLARLAALEDDYARVTKTDGLELPGHDREQIQALVADLPRVWHDPRTPARERKRMLRLLIEDVTLLRDRTIQLHIRWKSGATTSLDCPIPRGAPDLRRTPATIVEMVRALAAEHTDRQIADILNGRWLRTGTGQVFTRLRVRHIRTAHGIPRLADHLRQAGWLTATASFYTSASAGASGGRDHSRWKFRSTESSISRVTETAKHGRELPPRLDRRRRSSRGDLIVVPRRWLQGGERNHP
jgi:hypothetical protein